MNSHLSDLLKAVGDSPRPLDKNLITRAWEFADLAHTGQKRLSGEDYIIHPTKVAHSLISWNLDTTSVAAGLLHDSVEDGGASREDLVKNFGPDIARIVEGVTKVTGIHLTGSTSEQFVENMRKMILVMARDLRVVLVKLADRLHNMQTLQYLPPENRKENARETLEIYAPLAERLGIGEVKGLLEDLSFRYVYPEEQRKVVKESRVFYKRAEKEIKTMKRTLLVALAREAIKAKIDGRK